MGYDGYVGSARLYMVKIPKLLGYNLSHVSVSVQ